MRHLNGVMAIQFCAANDTMINESLLKIVVCPLSRQPLRVAEGSLVEHLNRAIAAGQVQDRAGRPITAPIEEGLLRQDGLLLYPIRDGIPVLLADEAIPLDFK
jgi:uncharacterized protein